MSTITNLDEISRNYQQAARSISRRVTICAGTGCVAGGALEVHQALVREIEARGLDAVVELKAEEKGGPDSIHLSKSGCQGFCQMGPLVTIEPHDLLYTKVKAADVPEIVEKTLVHGEVIARLLYVEPGTERRCRNTDEIPFYKRQMRFVLKECGLIDPEDIREYIARGGYEAARKAFLEMTSEQICEEILHSGLRGRGGGGFPTGRKWDIARKQVSEKKYVICNGDEGDPGAF
ncbi:MAG: NADH-quinone oxidoreductase subunit F, partial [Phycisphaerales bacterium]|nr:NADH-quinone oxidoreductase subunit F [Phycisphaerales bacterium]